MKLRMSVLSESAQGLLESGDNARKITCSSNIYLPGLHDSHVVPTSQEASWAAAFYPSRQSRGPTRVGPGVATYFPDAV
jgi:hypothetical protein